jgi:hypothetical protein
MTPVVPFSLLYSGASVQGIRIYVPKCTRMGSKAISCFVLESFQGSCWIAGSVHYGLNSALGVMACALLLFCMGKIVVNMYLSYLRYCTILTKFSSRISLVKTEKILTNTDQKYQFNIQLYFFQTKDIFRHSFYLQIGILQFVSWIQMCPNLCKIVCSKYVWNKFLLVSIQIDIY